MIVYGIDPGTSATAIAAWSDEGPLTAALVRAKGGPPGLARAMQRLQGLQIEGRLILPCLVVVEGQQIDRRSKSKASIITLAQSAGVAVSWAASEHPDAEVVIPTPAEWKGGVQKHAHQARLYADLGWGYTIVGGREKYARPEQPPAAFAHVKPGAWKDVGDAILLARWGHEQHS